MRSALCRSRFVDKKLVATSGTIRRIGTVICHLQCCILTKTPENLQECHASGDTSTLIPIKRCRLCGLAMLQATTFRMVYLYEKRDGYTEKSHARVLRRRAYAGSEEIQYQVLQGIGCQLPSLKVLMWHCTLKFGPFLILGSD